MFRGTHSECRIPSAYVKTRLQAQGNPPGDVENVDADMISSPLPHNQHSQLISRSSCGCEMYNRGLGDVCPLTLKDERDVETPQSPRVVHSLRGFHASPTSISGRRNFVESPDEAIFGIRSAS